MYGISAEVINKAQREIARCKEERQRRIDMLADYARSEVDWHGVMDMSAEIREYDERIEAIEWVLGLGADGGHTSSSRR